MPTGWRSEYLERVALMTAWSKRGTIVGVFATTQLMHQELELELVHGLAGVAAHVPGRDLEGRAKDLRTHKLCHGE